jgi:ADP-ribose pyrophosphatase YjhB (NUDIX family)
MDLLNPDHMVGSQPYEYRGYNFTLPGDFVNERENVEEAINR